MTTKNPTDVLKDLKNEISETLLWFAEMDLNSIGKLSQSTKECFARQGVSIPHQLLQLEKA